MAKKQHSRQRSSIPFGKRVLIPILVAFFLVAAALTVWLWPSAAPADQFPRLEVAGFRITEQEYLRAMYQARNDVLSAHAAASISLKDWSAETALGDPRQLTVDRALEILAEYYAVGTLAVERGYLSDAGFEAMQQDMERINSQRQEALEEGAIITGFSNFSLNDYIDYRTSSLRLQFCNDLENPENQVTDEEILRRYEADRDNLYRQPDAVELAFVVISSGTEDQKQLLESARQIAVQKGSLAAAVEEIPQLQEFFQEISVDPTTYSTYARSHSDILAYSDDLNTGEFSQVLDFDGWLCLIECRERIDYDYVPLEDVQSIVVQSIRTERYDAMIEARVESTRIDGDMNSLYRFTAEQLP